LILAGVVFLRVWEGWLGRAAEPELSL
jgi:hypothetical protein